MLSSGGTAQTGYGAGQRTSFAKWIAQQFTGTFIGMSVARRFLHESERESTSPAQAPQMNWLALSGPVFPNLLGIAFNFGYCDPRVTGRHSALDQAISLSPEVIVKTWLLMISRRHSTSKPVSEDVSQGAKLLGFYGPT
jgi:hypothetical protein